MKPSIGRIVHFHDADGNPVAAVVTATKESMAAKGNANPDLDLSSDTHVHLHVFGLTVSGQGLDVPFAEDAQPLTWGWPPRV